MRPSGTGTSSLLPAVFSLCQTGLARYLVSVFPTGAVKDFWAQVCATHPSNWCSWVSFGLRSYRCYCCVHRLLGVTCTVLHCSVSVSLNQRRPDSVPSTCLAGNYVGTSCLRNRNRSVFSSSKIILFDNFWHLCFALVAPLSRRIFSHSLPDKLLCTLKGPISFTQTLTPWGSGWAFSILLQISFLI